MTEPNPGTKLGQASLSGRNGCRGADAEPGRGAPYQRRVTRRVGRRDDQQLTGRIRECIDTAPEAFRQAARAFPRAGKPEPARQLCRGQPAWQLEKCQRVTMRLGDDLLAHPRVDRADKHPVEDRPRVLVAQAVDGTTRQARELWCYRTRGEDQADRLCPESSGRERQDLGGGLVEPLPVVGQA